MNNKKISSLVACLFCASFAQAGSMGPMPMTGFHPFLTVLSGINFLSMKGKQTHTEADGGIFLYNTPSRQAPQITMGIQLGGERALSTPGFSVQAGIEYSNLWPSKLSGSHTAGDEPATSTLYNYQYHVEAQQVLAMAKLLGTLKQSYRPYVLGGIGASFNRIYRFHAHTEESGSINLTPVFANHNRSSFSYTLGLGIEKTINEHARVGLGYRFSDLGKSSLGNGTVTLGTFSALSPFTLTNSHLYANQLVAQVSYIA